VIDLKSRILNVASALIFVAGILCLVHALQDIFLAASMDEGFLDVSLSQIQNFSPDVMGKLTLLYQINGLRLIVMGSFFCVISLLPYRKGEKWAWYTMLGIRGFGLIGSLVLVYAYIAIQDPTFLYGSIVLIVLWAIGMILPVKEIFGKK
jgi:hypothetical protein